MNAIQFDSVSKSYAVYASPGDRLKEFALLQRKSLHRDFWALKDVSFSVARGEAFCVVGENGAGKSTLLQLISGILQPTEGTAAVSGRVSALLELGSGFNPEFTGRDNVYLNGAILRFSKAEMDAKYPHIADFAEIGEFLDRPVKMYSSGMVVRLAFAVAIHTDPEVLLVDEALSVGDYYFRQRCMRKVAELQAAGVTIVLVSHAIGDVLGMGGRTMWLDHGRVRQLGPTKEIVRAYLDAMAAKDSEYTGTRQAATAGRWVETIPNIDRRYGDGRAEIAGIALLESDGSPATLISPSSPIVLRISFRAKNDLSHPIAGFVFRNHLGIELAASDSDREHSPLAPMRKGEAATIDFELDLPDFYPGFFSFSGWVGEAPDTVADFVENAVTVQMAGGDNQIYGYIHLPCRVELNAVRSEQVPGAEAVVD